MPGSELVRRDDEQTAQRLPLSVGAQVYAHLVLTRDIEQHRRWKDRLEAIHQAEAVAETDDPREKSTLSRGALWRRIRRSSKRAANYNMIYGGLFTLWLLDLYALGHGFGLWPTLAYLLPLPVAWKAARRTFQRGATRALAARSPERGDDSAGSLARGIGWSFRGGFKFGFTLLFLQGLISWFMTPAPTLGLELFYDLWYAVWGGLATGTASLLLGPSIAGMLGSDRGRLDSADDSRELLEA